MAEPSALWVRREPDPVRRRKTFERTQSILFVLLAILAGLMFTRSPGTGDVEAWKFWTNNAVVHGPVEGYAANQDAYPPLASAFLFGAFRLFRSLAPDIDSFSSVKLAIFVFLLLTALITWLWTRELKITLILYFSLLLNSVALGYIDILFAPTLLLSLWMLKERRLLWFTVFFTLSCLTKAPPLIIAPFIALYILDFRRIFSEPKAELKRLFLQVVLPAGGLIALVLVVYRVTPVWTAFNLSFRIHGCLSCYALNLNWIILHLLQVFQPDNYGGLQNGLAGYPGDEYRLVLTQPPPEIALVSRLLFWGFYLAALLLFLRSELARPSSAAAQNDTGGEFSERFVNLLVFATLGFLAYFMFNIGVHENHLFIVTILAVLIFWLDESLRAIAVILLIISNINLFLFYGVDGVLHFPRLVGNLDVALPLAVFNVLFFFYLCWYGTTRLRSPQTARSVIHKDQARARVPVGQQHKGNERDDV
jgi:hypothetical protein